MEKLENFKKLLALFPITLATKDLIKKYKQEDLNTALKIFCEHGYFDHIREIVEFGADVRVDENYCIKVAASNRYFDIVLYLGEQGGNIKACKNLELEDVFKERKYHLAKFMIENNMEIKDRNIDLLILCRFYGLSTKYL